MFGLLYLLLTVLHDFLISLRCTIHDMLSQVLIPVDWSPSTIPTSITHIYSPSYKTTFWADQEANNTCKLLCCTISFDCSWEICTDSSSCGSCTFEHRCPSRSGTNTINSYLTIAYFFRSGTGQSNDTMFAGAVCSRTWCAYQVLGYWLEKCVWK